MTICEILLQDTENEEMDISHLLTTHINHSDAVGSFPEKLAQFGEEQQRQTEDYATIEIIEEGIKALRQITQEMIFRQTVDQTISEIYETIKRLFGDRACLKQIGAPYDHPKIAALLTGLTHEVSQKVINVVWASFIMLAMQKVINRLVERDITTEDIIEAQDGPADIVTNQLYEKYGVVPGEEDGWDV